MKKKLLTLLITVAFLLITSVSIVSLVQLSKVSKENEPEIVKVMLKKTNSQNFYVVATANGKELDYAYYVYKDNKLLKKFAYKQDSHLEYKVNQPGVYKMRVFVKDNSGKIVAKSTNILKM